MSCTVYRIIDCFLFNISRYIVGNSKDMKSLLCHPLVKPNNAGQDYLQFEGYWIPVGTIEPYVPDNYVITESVRCNIKDLARIISIGKFPILLQVKLLCIDTQ